MSKNTRTETEEFELLNWQDLIGKNYSEIRSLMDVPLTMALTFANGLSSGEKAAEERLTAISYKFSGSISFLSGGALALIAALLSSQNRIFDPILINYSIKCFVISLFLSILSLGIGFLVSMRHFLLVTHVVSSGRAIETFFAKIQDQDLNRPTNRDDPIDFLVNEANNISKRMNSNMAWAVPFMKFVMFLTSLGLIIMIGVVVIGAVLTLNALQ